MGDLMAGGNQIGKLIASGVSRIFGKGTKTASGAGKVISKGGGQIIEQGGKIIVSGRKALLAGAGGGLTAFFGFEWLTNSGLVRATAGTLGVSTDAASVLIVGTTVIVIGIVLYALYKRLTSNKPAPRKPR